jgi:predicted O-methyltransferase YrrM
VSGHHLVSPSRVLGSILLEVDMEYPNWFEQTAQYNFDVMLQEYVGKDGLRFLQLGAYTGDASVWMLENILTGEYSKLTDVDTWKGSKELAHEEMDFEDVYKTYLSKVKPFENVNVVKSTTLNFFTAGDMLPGYDFIYVDADHTTVGVLIDAELSWPWLMPGGIMAFDDYTWSHESGDPRLAPKVGIDLFLHRHTGEYELLAVNDQVWIRKQ